MVPDVSVGYLKAAEPLTLLGTQLVLLSCYRNAVETAGAHPLCGIWHLVPPKELKTAQHLS